MYLQLLEQQMAASLSIPLFWKQLEPTSGHDYSLD